MFTFLCLYLISTLHSLLYDTIYIQLGTPSSPLNPNNERYLKEEEDSTKKRRLTEEEKKTTSSTEVTSRNHRKLQTNNDYCGTCAAGNILSQYSCTGYYTCLFGEIGPYRACGPGTVFDSSINNCNFDYATPECGCDASSPNSYASLNAPPTTLSPVQSPRFEDDGDLSGATTPPPSPLAVLHLLLLRRQVDREILTTLLTLLIFGVRNVLLDRHIKQTWNFVVILPSQLRSEYIVMCSYHMSHQSKNFAHVIYHM